MLREPYADRSRREADRHRPSRYAGRSLRSLPGYSTTNRAALVIE
jgi:hypothetical protein